MALDPDKLSLIEQIQEEKLKQRGKVLRVFIPEDPTAVPFPKQIAFLKDKSLTKLARCGNRAAKTFTNMRDLAWKITRTHWYRQEHNVFNIHDKKWKDKLDNPDFESRYLKTKAKLFWIITPTYDFGKGVAWEKYLEKMIPSWFIEEIKETNQKNIDYIRFKNGDVLKFKTYMQQETTKMGFVVDDVYFDEMPDDVKVLTEAIVRTFDCDGSVSIGFTPLVENEEVKNYLDTACASGTMSLHSWTVHDNPHYRDHPDRMARVLAEYANMSEQERNSRLGGDWYYAQPDKAVFEGLEPEVVDDFPIPLSWRQIRYTDPAIHVTGHTIFAEDPTTSIWYVIVGEEITWKHIVKAKDIVDVIEAYKPYESFQYYDSVYDNAELWFGAEGAEYGYRPCILKNREAAIMKTRELIATGRIRFFRKGGALAVKQFREYHYNKLGNKIVKKKDHVLDCVMYFCREIPKVREEAKKATSEIQEAILRVIAKAETPPKTDLLSRLRGRLVQRSQAYRPTIQKRGVR